MTSADMARRAASEHRNASPSDCIAQAVAWLKTKVGGRALVSASLKRCAALLEEWEARSRERAFLATLKETELRDMGLSSADRWREVNKPFWQA